MDADALLSHAVILRGLARELLCDSACAEDAVQDVYVEALARPPRTTTHVRAWLATVLHNLARRAVRSGRRRERRERVAARFEVLPSAHAMAQRREILNQVIDAVFETGEPYRTTLVLRFYEGLDIDEIASRMQVPRETVRTRLKRALARVRARLEARGADSNDWRPALLAALDVTRPLVGIEAGLARAAGSTSAADVSVPASLPTGSTATRSSVGSIAAGALVMSTASKSILAAAAIVAATAVVWTMQDQPAPPVRQATIAASASANKETDPQAASDQLPEATRTRIETELAGEHRTSIHEPALGDRRLYGRVRSEQGAPVPAATVQFRTWCGSSGPEEELLVETRTDAEGSYVADLAEALQKISGYARRATRLVGAVTAEGWRGTERQVRDELWSAFPPEDVDFVLERQQPLVHGRVLDHAGMPVAWDEIQVQLEGATEWAKAKVRIRDREKFALRVAEPGNWVVRAVAFSAGVGVSDPRYLDPAVDCTLPEIFVGGPGFLAGRLVHASGSPVEAALVRAELVTPMNSVEGLSHAECSTDSQGRFELRGLRQGIFRFECDAGVVRGDPRMETDHDDLSLVLDGQRVSVCVVDENQQPLAGAWVLVLRVENRFSIDLDAGGRHSFRAEPGKLRVGSGMPGRLPEEKEITVEPGVFDTEVELVLRSCNEELGAIAIECVDHAANGILVPSFVVTLKTSAGGPGVPGFRHVAPDRDGHLFAVPPGTWWAEIIPDRRVCRQFPDISWFDPVQMLVTVRPGAVTLLRVDAVQSARFSCIVHLEGLGPEVELSPLEITLFDASGIPQVLRAFVTELDDGRGMVGQIHTARKAVSNDCSRPGRYQVRFDMFGYQPLETTTELLPGNANPVEVTLRPGN